MAEIKKAYQDTSIGQIHYRYGGMGDNLLFLHRTPVTSEIFEPVMRLLASKYRVIAVDNPGFGMSAYPPRPFTIPDHAKIVLEVLDGLHIDATHVFGHHTGASIACELAAMAPGRVKKLILSAPPCFDEQERKRRLERIELPDITDDGAYMTVRWNYRTGLATGGPPDVDPEVKRRELAWRLRAGSRFIEGPRAVFSYDMPKRSPLIKAPTLVMSGEYDWLRNAVEPTAHLIKGARHYIVPGATNRIEVQKPEELARIITDFLSDPKI